MRPPLRSLAVWLRWLFAIILSYKTNSFVCTYRPSWSTHDAIIHKIVHKNSLKNTNFSRAHRHSHHRVFPACALQTFICRSSIKPSTTLLTLVQLCLATQLLHRLQHWKWLSSPCTISTPTVSCNYDTLFQNGRYSSTHFYCHLAPASFRPRKHSILWN